MARIAIGLLAWALLLGCQGLPVNKEAAQESISHFRGHWLYGFEMSILVTCEGKHYWMWAPEDYPRKYQKEGHRQGVRVEGKIEKPDPRANMNSPLETLTVTSMQLVNSPCNLAGSK